MEEVSGRISRAELRIVLFSVPFPASLFFFSFADPKQTRAPAHLGGTGAVNRYLDSCPMGSRSIRPMEIFHLDVSRAGPLGGEFSELAQVHRTRWDDGRHGKRRYPEHCCEELAGTAGCFHATSRTVSWNPSSTGRSAPFRFAATFGEITADKTGRASTVHRLSLRVD